MAEFQEHIFIDDANNKWIGDSNNSWVDAYSNLLRTGYVRQLYGLLSQGFIKQLWGLSTSSKNWIIQLYGIIVLEYIVQQYDDADTPQNAILQFYEDAGVPQNELIIKYEDALVVMRKVLQKWNIMSSPLGQILQSYGIAQYELLNYLEQPWNLEVNNKVERFIKQIWELLNEDSTISEDDVTNTVTTVDPSDDPVSTGNQVVGSSNINFVNGNEIVSDGGPDLSGYTDGMQIEVTGTANNDGVYTVSGDSTSTTITLVETVLTTESAQSPTIDEVVFYNYASAPTPFGFHEVKISGSLSSYVMSCDLDLSKDDFYLFSDLDEINLTINSEDYSFLVTQVTRSFAHGKSTYKIHGKSRGVLLEIPYSKPLNEEYESEFASAIAQRIASAAGVTFVWEITDWMVSPNQIYANDESPLEVIRKLVQIPGGILQSDPDGTLRATYRYTEDLDNPGVITTFWTTGDNFFTASESYQEKPGYNKVYVGAELSSDENIQLSELESFEGQPDNTKYMAGYVVPWTGNTATLSTSSDDIDSIDYMGIVTETVEEEVEFVESVGTVSRPVYGLIDVVWNDDSYGTIADIDYLESGELELTSNSDAYTIATITYTTKYYKWKVVKNLIDDSTQLMLSVEK